MGVESPEDLMGMPGPVTLDRFVVKRNEVLGKTVWELELTQRYGVTVTRVMRADVELTAVAALRLQFGDKLQVVGKEADIAKVASVLGNSIKDMNRTNFMPMFIGIGLGVLLGRCIRFRLPTCRRRCGLGWLAARSAGTPSSRSRPASARHSRTGTSSWLASSFRSRIRSRSSGLSDLPTSAISDENDCARRVGKSPTDGERRGGESLDFQQQKAD